MPFSGHPASPARRAGRPPESRCAATAPAAPDLRRRLLAGGSVLALLALALGLRPSHLLAQSGAAPVRIGVIGSGRIGGTIGGLWVQAGHPVLFSSRHPEELKPLTDKLGPLARAGTVADALAFADVILLAVPYKALPEIAGQNGNAFDGKVVVDATNAVRARDGAIVDEAMSNGIGITTAKYLRGARVVRAFNFTGAADFAQNSRRAGALMAVPIAADDPVALRVGAQLVRDAGFEPVVVGPLATANSFATGGPLFRQMGSADELRARIAQEAGRPAAAGAMAK
ncbi:NADPH-dependent F420 reductase [Cupriavidus sp. 30B13]|uniref:NADPH-dependent F420 reductase n=1 Tax=Cupriavidus sp. 30B13 TaxID=3384241 RepID=UPI003B911FC9